MLAEGGVEKIAPAIEPALALNEAEKQHPVENRLRFLHGVIAADGFIAFANVAGQAFKGFTEVGEEFLVELLDGEGVDHVAELRPVPLQSQHFEALSRSAAGFGRAKQIGIAARSSLAFDELAGFIEGRFTGGKCETVGRGICAAKCRQHSVIFGLINEARHDVAQSDAVAGEVEIAVNGGLNDAKVPVIAEADTTELQDRIDAGFRYGQRMRHGKEFGAGQHRVQGVQPRFALVGLSEEALELLFVQGHKTNRTNRTYF